MSVWMGILIVLAVTVFLTHPRLDRRRMHRWRGVWFAHRGLHDASRGILENTLPAFEAARNAGFGMELDVQRTKDGHLVVFHDDDLLRLAEDPRRVTRCTLAELRALTLGGVPGAGIPTFEEVLKAVDGRVPLLVELKNGPDNRRMCEQVLSLLEDYGGPYLVESFNPLIVAWFRFHAPQVIRGQLVGPMSDYVAQVNQIGAFFMAGLLANFAGRPDFVSYDVNARRFFSPHFQRFLYHTPMAAWTVKDEQTAALIRARQEIGIFEEIRPGKQKY